MAIYASVAMPEATTYLNYGTISRQNDVGLARQLGCMDSKAETKTVECASDE